MKTKILLAAVILFAVNAMASADFKLQTKVITSSPEGLLVNSTLVSGDKEAILIDAQLTQSDAHRVVAAVLESRKNLTTVYVTHAHPDHYFGFGVIRQAFPNAKIVALPSVIKDINDTWEAKVKTWKPVYGDNLTSSPVIPEALQGTTLMLDGETMQIFGEVQGDAKNNSYVWIPSLKTVVAGDVAYHGVYPWTLETTPAERKEWIKTLDKIASLKPAVVVAGHKKPELKDDPSSLQFTKNYLTYYDQALASSKTAEEFRSKINSKFPQLSLDIILKLASDAAFSKEKKN
jgi:glyoxylase-like metal-dependent hydrolase (beta-lactamase superfamily II)